MQPPRADRRPITTEHHGRSRVDDYEWLRDKDSPEVRALPRGRERLHRGADRPPGRPAARRSSTRSRPAPWRPTCRCPTRSRGYWYYGRSFEGTRVRRQLPRPGDATPTTGRRRSPPRTARPTSRRCPASRCCWTSTSWPRATSSSPSAAPSVSPDGTLLAYSTDVVGDERYTVRVKDLGTGELLARRDHRRARRRHVGPRPARTSTTRPSTRPGAPTRSGGTGSAPPRPTTSWSSTRTDGRFWVGVGRTRTDRFLVIAAGSKTTSRVPRPRHRRVPSSGSGSSPSGARASSTPSSTPCIGGEDRFLVLHNGTGADFELAIAPVDPTPPEDWQPLIAHDPAVRLEDVDAFAGHLVVHQRSEGLTQLRILELDDARRRRRLPGRVRRRRSTRSARPATRRFDQPTVRLGYTTMAVPSSVYDYDVRTRELTLLKRAPGAVGGATTPTTTRSTGSGRPPTTASGCRSRSSCRRGARAARRPRAAAALRLRRLRDVDRPLLLGRPALAARPRRRVRDRARPRRRRDGPALVRRRQARCTSRTPSPTSSPAPGTSSTPAGPPPTALVAEGGSAGGLLMGAVANQAPELFGGIVAQRAVRRRAHHDARRDACR